MKKIFRDYIIGNWEKIIESYSVVNKMSKTDFYVIAFILNHVLEDVYIIEFMDVILSNKNLYEHINIIDIHTQLMYIYNEGLSTEVPLNKDFGKKFTKILFKHMLVKVFDMDNASEEIINNRPLILSPIPALCFYKYNAISNKQSFYNSYVLSTIKTKLLDDIDDYFGRLTSSVYYFRGNVPLNAPSERYVQFLSSVIEYMSESKTEFEDAKKWKYFDLVFKKSQPKIVGRF